MKLSRLVLNPLSRDVARAVADVNRLHQVAMMGFDPAEGPARARHGVLYRLEVDPRGGALVLYVQSASQPDWSRLPARALADLEAGANPQVRDLSELDLVETGAIVRFRLRANATRKIATKSVDGRRRHGRRVPHRDDEQCVAWLVRKGAAHGFEVVRSTPGPLQLTVNHEPLRRGRRDGEGITFEGVRFDGLLRVVDIGAFRAGVIGGVGPGKAFGFGLLSFALG